MCTTDAAVVHILAGLRAQRMRSACLAADGVFNKWQKRLFAMAKAQQETQFAEVTPVSAMQTNSQIAVTVHAAGIAADIHNGANTRTVESVLRILKLC